ncbi:MAG: hypothetical protein AAF696_07320 [Bacteroidota bacterium]
MKIYRHEHVLRVQHYYGPLLEAFYGSYELEEHLLLLSEKLWQGIQEKNPLVAIELSNYHPDLLGQKWEEISGRDLNQEDAQRCILAQYGFNDWEECKELKYDIGFETLVNYVLWGKLEAIKQLLTNNPELISQKSSYGHQASILHYCASNGLELWRQQVPTNLPEITEYLLAHGADKSVKMKVYGGEFTPLPLLESSAHPFAAGVGERMKVLLS